MLLDIIFNLKKSYIGYMTTHNFDLLGNALYYEDAPVATLGTYNYIEFRDLSFGVDTGTFQSLSDATTYVIGSSDDVIIFSNQGAAPTNVRYTGTTLGATVADSANVEVSSGATVQKSSNNSENEWSTVTPICLHPNTMIKTKRGEIKISELVKNDIVYKPDGEELTVISNLVSYPATKNFIMICKDAVAQNVPDRDTLITEGHPIIVDGVEVQPNELLEDGKFERVTLSEPVLTHNVCTKERVPIVMNNLGVITWAEHEFAEFRKNNAVKVKYL